VCGAGVGPTTLPFRSETGPMEETPCVQARWAPTRRCSAAEEAVKTSVIATTIAASALGR
jgi:hypothetical protein